MSGLYVRSNVPALTSANYLSRNLADLSNIMTRLSTGLRINSGKDDPAGLIASELLKADMTATTKAITNVQRANSMVAIADAALGQVSNLLNDIRGLINEAANTATMTPEMIAANQLQVDAAIDSIDRIAKTTNYLGKLLLDGTMDFQTRGLNRNIVKGLTIHEANFGTSTSVDVGINVIQDATHAKLLYDKAGVSQATVIEVSGNDGSSLINIAENSTVDQIANAINLVSDSTGVRAVVGKDATAGQIFITSAGLDNDINITSLVTGAAAGNYTFKFTAGNSEKTTYTITDPQNGKPGIIEFHLQMQPSVAPGNDRLDEGDIGLRTYDITGTRWNGIAKDIDIVVQTSNGQQIKQVEFVQFTATNSLHPNSLAATFNSTTGKLQIHYDAAGNVTEEALRQAINAIEGFEYMGIYRNENGAYSKLSSTGNASEIGTTGVFLSHIDDSINNKAVSFISSGGSSADVSVSYDGNTITVASGSAATYDQILAALNAPASWLMPSDVIPPAPYSFALVGADGYPVDGTTTQGLDGTSTILHNGPIGTNAKQTALTPLEGGVFLRTTDPAWNGIEFEIEQIPSAGDVTVGGMTFSAEDMVKLAGIQFVFDTNEPIPGGTGAPSGFDSATGTLTLNTFATSGTAQLADLNTLISNFWSQIQQANGSTATSPPQASAVSGESNVTPPLMAAAVKEANDLLAAQPKVVIVYDDSGLPSSPLNITVQAREGATYAEILAALKKSSAWTSDGTAVLGTVPDLDTSGLLFATSAGIPVAATMAAQTTSAPATLAPVSVSDATMALRQWLINNGTGTKTSVDLRANNALEIKAAVAGTKFENTDVVYVKSQGATFSSAFPIGTQNAYLSSTGTGAQGYSVQFVTGGASTDVNAVLNGQVLTVTIGTRATIANVLDAINDPSVWDSNGDTLPDPVSGYSVAANWGTFSFVDPTKMNVDTTLLAASHLGGRMLYMSNVQLDYRDTPTPAAATITIPDSTVSAAKGGGDVKMRIVANSVGTCYNDVMIEFEQDNSFKPGDVAVVYDEARKILHIRGQIEGANAATYGMLKAAIEAHSPFHIDITSTLDNKIVPLSYQIGGGASGAGWSLGTDERTTGLASNSPKGSSVIRMGQVVGDVGGNNQTLYVTVAANATGSDVVKAFSEAKGTSAQIAANFIVNPARDNDGSGAIFDSRFDADIEVRVFVGALTGGNSGLMTNVTAKELVDFINNDAVLSKLFLADVARGQIGNGFLTLFDEAAYYGSTLNDNALQFLGPKDSPDVLFVIDGPGSKLGISFVDDYGTGCVTDSRPVASLNATHANAAFLVQAMTGGLEYEDMVVRMIRLDNNHTSKDSYATYQSGPSNAMAYCSINNDNDGTATEKGKFIVYGNRQGDQLNNVDIVVRIDENQTNPATAIYDETTKRLIVTVNNAETTTLNQAIAAINNEGTFRAEYDFSFNNRNESDSDGPGLATFADILGSGMREAVIGNTGMTGGHKGGVLEVYIGGEDHEITAQAVINTINNGPTVKNLFNASALGGTGAGTGLVDFRNDNIRNILGADGKWRNESNMVTGILGSDMSSPGYMVIHLATDANGNSITTAADLVKFFDSLTPEQTRGISVSVVRPPGVDNLDRVWTVGPCGELLESQLCDNQYGLGLLQPTYYVDDCGDYYYFPIEFFSYGEDKKPGNAHGSVVAQNGIDASLTVRSKIQGADFNGVNFQYVRLGDPLAAMYAEYDAYTKMITVFIQEGATAAQVKNVIETSETTRNLFEISLPGTGLGVVSLQDDYLLMKGGIFDAGYRGGAAMLGAADADAHKLIIESMGEGSRQYVSVRWLSGGDFHVKDINGNTADTAYGADMVATINGMKASADGRSLSLSSAMLKMNVILDRSVTTGDSINFTITGGGALVQMGPDVVSNQQVRFGLPSVSSAHLGGGSGQLYQLRTGEAANLEESDSSRRLADRIIQESILAVSQLRGRLGALQRNTLEPQIDALQDSLVAMTSAEAQISNADFAEESSRLTRAQILVQAGTRTLSIANQFPQYAASLLGG